MSDKWKPVGRHTFWPETGNVTSFQLAEVPEYRPPRRVEQGLARLPAGAVWVEDLSEDEQERLAYEARERLWLKPAPADFYKTFKRFEQEFGKEAAYRWDIKIPDAWLVNRIMKEVWTSESMMRQFYDSSPFLDNLKGKTEVHVEAVSVAKVPIVRRDSERGGAE